MIGQIVSHSDGFSYVLMDEHNSLAHFSFRRFHNREECIANALKWWGKGIKFVDRVDPTEQ